MCIYAALSGAGETGWLLRCFCANACVQIRSSERESSLITTQARLGDSKQKMSQSVGVFKTKAVGSIFTQRMVKSYIDLGLCFGGNVLLVA